VGNGIESTIFLSDGLIYLIYLTTLM